MISNQRGNNSSTTTTACSKTRWNWSSNCLIGFAEPTSSSWPPQNVDNPNNQQSGKTQAKWSKLEACIPRWIPPPQEDLFWTKVAPSTPNILGLPFWERHTHMYPVSSLGIQLAIPALISNPSLPPPPQKDHVPLLRIHEWQPPWQHWRSSRQRHIPTTPLRASSQAPVPPPAPPCTTPGHCC